MWESLRGFAQVSVLECCALFGHLPMLKQLLLRGSSDRLLRHWPQIRHLSPEPRPEIDEYLEALQVAKTCLQRLGKRSGASTKERRVGLDMIGQSVCTER